MRTRSATALMLWSDRYVGRYNHAMPTKPERSTERSAIERLKASGRLDVYRAMQKRLAEGGAVTEPSDPKPDPLPDLNPDQFADKKPTTLLQDIQWVYSNLEVHVSPEDAPSAGAWALLSWARKHKNEFFRTHVPKLDRIGGEDPDAPLEPSDQDLVNLYDRLADMARDARLESGCDQQGANRAKKARRVA